MKRFLIALTAAFSLFSHTYDVVIPVHHKDKDNIDTILDALEEKLTGKGQFYIVSKKKYTNRGIWVDESLYPFSIDEVEKELGGNGGDGTAWRRGWYYQQLLKFYAPQIIEDLTENFLVFDADTVPTHKMNFLDEEGRPILDHMNYGCFIHTYYPHVRKMLPRSALINKRKNPIVHHMIFTKRILDDLFERVEDRYEKPFWQAFCNLVADPTKSSKQQFYTGASEYMIYFYFCQNYYMDEVVNREVKIYDRSPTLKGGYPAWTDFASHHNYNR